MSQTTGNPQDTALAGVRELEEQYKNKLLGYSMGHEEPDWLRRWRLAAWEVYQETPLPLRAQHLWRYSDPEIFLPEGDPFQKFEDPEHLCPEDLQKHLDEEEHAASALLCHGRMAWARMAPGVEKAGLVLTDIHTAARKHPELLQRVLGQIVGPEFGKFEALNAALFRGGLFLYVPRNLRLEAPIHLVKAFADRKDLLASRLAVLVEEGAEVTLVDHLQGGPEKEPLRKYGVAEIRLEQGAAMSFVAVQELRGGTMAHQTQRAWLGRDARYVSVLASFGGSLTKVDAGAVLDGQGSSSEMYGFLSGIGRQRFDHRTVHHHVGRHTHSNLDFKTVLSGRARSAYTGLIRIEKGASYSEAYQENRNLLLSSKTRADSIPELEILTEEVACTHGATAGPIDQEHLFYLMCRGIPRKDAVRIIVEGHFESAMQRLPEALRDRLRGIVAERLAMIEI